MKVKPWKKAGWTATALNTLPTCEHINRHQTSTKDFSGSRGGMQSAKLTSTQWRGDMGRFPAGGRFNKRTKTNTVWAVAGLLRGEDGGTLDTSSCRKEAELWKKSKQQPWTALCNPAVNPRPYLPTTSHYLCTTFSPRTAERTRTRTRSIVWGCLDRGGSEGGGVLFMEGSKEWKPTCSQGNYKNAWTLDGVCSHSQQGEEICCSIKATRICFACAKYSNVAQY